MPSITLLLLRQTLISPGVRGIHSGDGTGDTSTNVIYVVYIVYKENEGDSGVGARVSGHGTEKQWEGMYRTSQRTYGKHKEDTVDNRCQNN